MNRSDYQNFTPTTVKYAKDKEFSYLYLGLCGEVMEVIKAILAYTKDKGQENRELLEKEFGDIAYFLSQIHNMNAWRWEKAEASYCNPLILNGLEGADVIISSFAKHDREDFDFLELEERCAKGLRIINAWYTNCLEHYNIDESLCLRANCDKLTKRNKENKIKGDGDTR